MRQHLRVRLIRQLLTDARVAALPYSHAKLPRTSTVVLSLESGRGDPTDPNPARVTGRQGGRTVNLPLPIWGALL
jgi:hypothetical protein